MGVLKLSGRCWIVLLVLALLTAPAHAQLGSADVLDTVVGTFEDIAKTWGAAIQLHAERLFLILAAISMAWTFGMMALRQADLLEFLAELIKFVTFFGFFFWLLQNGIPFAIKLVASMQQIGTEAANGGKTPLTPSGIVDIGFDIFFRAVDKSSIFSPIISAAILITSGLILGVLAVIASQMIELAVASWMLIYAGVFFLGFGGSRWTSDIAVYYYKTVLGVGAEMMTMALLVGVASTLLTAFITANDKSVNLKALAVMFVATYVLFRLCQTLPGRMAAIATGGAVRGGENGGVGAAALMAATVMAGAAMRMTAQNVAGGTSAVSEAVRAARTAAAAGAGPGGVRGVAAGAASRLMSAATSVTAQRAGRTMTGGPRATQRSFTGQMARTIAAGNGQASSHAHGTQAGPTSANSVGAGQAAPTQSSNPKTTP